MGECDKKTSEDMLDFFYENGGNFIDTFVSNLLLRFEANSSKRQQLPEGRVREMGRRLDEEAWKQRPDGYRNQVHDSLPRDLWRQGDHCKHWWKWYQELAYLSSVELGQPADLIHRPGMLQLPSPRPSFRSARTDEYQSYTSTGGTSQPPSQSSCSLSTLS